MNKLGLSTAEGTEIKSHAGPTVTCAVGENGEGKRSARGREWRAVGVR